MLALDEIGDKRGDGSGGGSLWGYAMRTERERQAFIHSWTKLSSLSTVCGKEGLICLTNCYNNIIVVILYWLLWITRGRALYPIIHMAYKHHHLSYLIFYL